MLPRVVRADRLSVLPVPVASKVVSSVSCKRSGSASWLPPLSASRLEPFTSVKPVNVYEPPKTVRLPSPVKLAHWLVAISRCRPA